MEFTEYYNGCGLTVKVKRKIVEEIGVQKIEIYETESFGKMLVIDGKIQFTEFDEAFYHEMLVHVPMFTHPNPKRVLIIGGGDGGALREALKHDPEKVTLVEIDRTVIDLCKKYVGLDKGAFDDERVEIIIEDGLKYLKKCSKYDVIIVDSTDPISVSSTLFGVEFFETASKKCDVFCCQAQSPLIQKEYFKTLLNNSKPFKKRKIYISIVPTYPLALWSFLLAGEIDNFYEERAKDLEGTKYYNVDIHKAAFILPEWLKKEVSRCI